MSIQYLSDGKQFSLSYGELKEHYHNFVQMSDSEFMDNVNDALHFACIVCYLKEVPTYVCLNDTGIVHELAHLICEGTTTPLSEIREAFAVTLKLA